MSTQAQSIIDEAYQVLMKTYAPQPIVMDSAKGVYSYDTDGKKYVDFACGIAVASLGHGHEAVLKTIREQSERLMTVQASYATHPKLAAAKILTENSCFDTVYFGNSGTESVEAALKLVRKWAYDNKSKDCNEIIAFHHSFHGRTYGAASITEKRLSQKFYEPYLPGIHFADFDDIGSVRALISEKTAAIIIEPVQGEGGLNPMSAEFARDLRTLCDEQNIALIFDEVQAGMGRLGTLFAYEQFGVEPDVVCLAKGLGSGFPVGATLAKQKFSSFEHGTHGTTYGGNPLATAVAHTVVSELLKPGFLDHVNAVGTYITNGLKDIQRSSNKITEIRGQGLMIGVDTTIEIKKLMRALQNNGLLTTQAGKATLRLTPPLILKEAQAQEALDIIDKTLKEED